MKTNICGKIPVVLSMVGLGVASGFCETERTTGTPPSGTFGVTVNGRSNVVWDLTPLSEFHDIALEVARLNAKATFAVDFTQDGAGKLRGAGTTDLDVQSELFSGTIPEAAYRFSGSITSKGGVARVGYTVTVTGRALVNGRPVRLLGTKAVTMTLNATTGVVAGRHIDKMSAPGIGSGTESQVFADLISTPFGEGLGNGSWTLTLDVVTEGHSKASLQPAGGLQEAATGMGPQSSEPAIGQQGSGTAIGPQGGGIGIGLQSSAPTIGPQTNGVVIGPQRNQPAIGQQGSGTAIGPQSSAPAIGLQGSGTAIGSQSRGIGIGLQSSAPAIGPQANGVVIGPQQNQPAIGQQGSGTAIGPQTNQPTIGPQPLNQLITGGADLVLSSGARYGFQVKGVYAPGTGTSTLRLSAKPDCRGSSLTVMLAGESRTVSRIQGKISGQTVDYIQK